MQVSYEFFLVDVIAAKQEWKNLVLSSYKGHKILDLLPFSCRASGKGENGYDRSRGWKTNGMVCTQGNRGFCLFDFFLFIYNIRFDAEIKKGMYLKCD